MGGSDPVLVDAPAPSLRRVTLNRPEKRNALDNPMRGALFAALPPGVATGKALPPRNPFFVDSSYPIANANVVGEMLGGGSLRGATSADSYGRIK